MIPIFYGDKSNFEIRMQDLAVFLMASAFERSWVGTIFKFAIQIQNIVIVIVYVFKILLSYLQLIVQSCLYVGIFYWQPLPQYL